MTLCVMCKNEIDDIWLGEISRNTKGQVIASTDPADMDVCDECENVAPCQNCMGEVTDGFDHCNECTAVYDVVNKWVSRGCSAEYIRGELKSSGILAKHWPSMIL